MKKYIINSMFLTLILSLSACRPEQDAAEFNLTKAPVIADGFHFETMMNNPVEVQYQAESSESNSSLQIILITKPKFGELTACQNQSGFWKCIYIPKQDFFGDDFLEFQTKDGDFSSEKLAKVTIKVLRYNYVAAKKIIQIPSRASTVCDPLTGGEQGEAGKGLAGNIRLLNNPEDNSIRNNLNSYANPALSYQVPNLNLFMNKVDVAKRAFDLGFTAQDNQVLSVDGNPLIEYFNVNLQSILKITDEEKAGEYELAIISDDGSRLSYKKENNDSYTTYLESTATHAPKMLCALSLDDSSRFIKFEKDKGLEININYFQGPRYHIALQLLWRKKDLATQASSLCNNGINTDNFGNLILEGWNIIPVENFFLPSGVINTCDEENDELAHVSFSIARPTDSNLSGIIKNLKVKFKNITDGSIIELEKEDYILSNAQLVENEVLFDIDFSTPIIRDVDKEIIIEFDQRAL